MYCNNCGKQINDNVKFCPYCGADCSSEEVKNTNSKNDNKSSKLWMGIMVAVLVFSIATVGFIVPNIIRNKYIKQADKYIEMKEYDYAVATLKDVPKLLKKSKKIRSRIKFDDNKTSLMDKNGKCRYVVCEHSKWIYNENGDLFEVYGEIDGEYKPIFETEYMEGGHVLTKINNLSDYERKYIEYDSFGNKIEEINFTMDGEIANTHEFEYDDSGNLYKEMSYTGVGKIFAEDEYDSEGNLIRKDEYDENEDVKACYKYEYDSEGNLIKKEWNARDRWSLEEYEYDSKGNITKLVMSNKDGTEEIYTKYEYDSEGNLIRADEYDEDGNVKSYYKYEYDSEGNLIRADKYDEDGNIMPCFESEYNSIGNEIKHRVYFENGEIQSEYECNSMGNWTKFVSYDHDGNIEDYSEYEYDDEENVIKRVFNMGTEEVTQLFEYGMGQKYNSPVTSKNKKGFEYVAVYELKEGCVLSNCYDEDSEQEETEDIE